MRNIAILFAAAAFAILAGAIPASAEMVFTAVLSGAHEVPPNPSPATGSATLTLNDDQTEVAYVIEFEGLTAPETAAHFHNAPPGLNGAVMFPLPTGSPKIGIWPITAPQVAELLDNRVYVNIHTSNYPGGEIRGDISLQSVSGQDASWGRIKSLFH